MGVATGCGFMYIDFLIYTTYPYSSCICTFLQQHPYFFVHLKKCFFVLYRVGFNPDSDGFNWISWGCGHS